MLLLQSPRDSFCLPETGAQREVYLLFPSLFFFRSSRVITRGSSIASLPEADFSFFLSNDNIRNRKYTAVACFFFLFLSPAAVG